MLQAPNIGAIGVEQFSKPCLRQATPPSHPAHELAEVLSGDMVPRRHPAHSTALHATQQGLARHTCLIFLVRGRCGVLLAAPAHSGSVRTGIRLSTMAPPTIRRWTTATAATGPFGCKAARSSCPPESDTTGTTTSMPVAIGAEAASLFPPMGT